MGFSSEFSSEQNLVQKDSQVYLAYTFSSKKPRFISRRALLIFLIAFILLLALATVSFALYMVKRNKTSNPVGSNKDQTDKIQTWNNPISPSQKPDWPVYTASEMKGSVTKKTVLTTIKVPISSKKKLIFSTKKDKIFLAKKFALTMGKTKAHLSLTSQPIFTARKDQISSRKTSNSIVTGSNNFISLTKMTLPTKKPSSAVLTTARSRDATSPTARGGISTRSTVDTFPREYE